jgi:type VI secretion system protein ImpG
MGRLSNSDDLSGGITVDDEIEKIFLDELAALDRFRISYTGTFPNTPLSREDPDVRRLLEGLAMFTARTRVASARSLHRNVLRMFRQHFSHVLGPVPAMGMLRARPTPRFVDATVLPSGSEVLLVEPGMKGADDRTFRFRTMGEVRVLPLELESVVPLRLPNKTLRLVFQFRWTTRHAMMMDIGDLRLHINHLDDLASSLTVAYALGNHLQSASVVFGQTVREDTVGSPCRVTFGPLPRIRDAIERVSYPLRDLRMSLGFPRQHLYMHIQGIKLPRAVEKFAVCLDLEPGFPMDLRPNQDGFELFSVPIVNERIEMANPIEHDGTKERHLVVHPDVGSGFVVSDIFGVYTMTDKGLDPLEPAVMPASAGRSRDNRSTYDVTYEGQGARRNAFVMLDVAGAFDKPVNVAIEALWHQPSVDTLRMDDVRVALGDRHLAGVSWSCSGGLIPHAESAIEENDQDLLELLSIKNQRVLDLEHIRCLLRAIGAAEGSPHEKFTTAMQRVSVIRKPAAKSATGFKYIYHIDFAELGPSEIPKLDVYCRRLYDLLSAWSTEEVIELVAHVAGGRATVHIEGSA